MIENKMTSTLSVSEHKRGHRHHAKNYDGKPREGSLLRQFYDDLRNGEVVAFSHNRRAKAQLADFYGMEFETVTDDRNRIIGSRLLGEWIGSEYIPVERLTVSLVETE